MLSNTVDDRALATLLPRERAHWTNPAPGAAAISRFSLSILAAFFVVLAAACTGGGNGNNSNTPGSSDDHRDTLVRSQAAGEAAGNRPAAIVNGVTIPLADVERVRVNAEVWPITGVDPRDTPSIINFLVGQELQRQEAAKRGIVVTDDEVSAAIARDQKAYPQLLASGQAPANITNLIDAYAKAGHPMAKWQTDPLVRASYYNLLLDVALSGELAKAASLSDKAPGKAGSHRPAHH